ncbi:MAG: hypothetical protein H7839_23700, partial [Magnetococcus sp. YQC-5]
EQAKGHAKALVTVMKQTESRLDELADKRDKQVEDRLHGLATKQDLDTKIKELEYRMTIRLGLMLVAVAGMLFTALRHFPPTQPIVISNHQMPTLEQKVGKTQVAPQPAP